MLAKDFFLIDTQIRLKYNHRTLRLTAWCEKEILGGQPEDGRNRQRKNHRSPNDEITRHSCSPRTRALVMPSRTDFYRTDSPYQHWQQFASAAMRLSASS